MVIVIVVWLTQLDAFTAYERGADQMVFTDIQGALPAAIRSRMIPAVNGLDLHILEAGHKETGRPLALLLHGFPDLAYGWRHVMPLLAEAGYHVVAPDQRGYGQTTGWSADYDAPLAPFGILNMVRDTLALVAALGYSHTSMLVGHDFGSPIAAYCAIARPDVFPSVVLMSAPFPGVPAFPFDTADKAPQPQPAQSPVQQLAAGLAALDPPRELYQHYFASRSASDDPQNAPEGLRQFFRTFFHVKSADWAGNAPHPLSPASPEAFAALPTYYVMEKGKTMPENVAPFRPSDAEVAAAHWLTEPELDVYVEAFSRTGFQGAMQGYRVLSDPALGAELRLFSGRTLDVPSLFIGGDKDWAPYISPGALDLMQTTSTTQLRDVAFVEGAGHWIQQEQPAQLARLLVDFAAKVGDGGPKSEKR